MVYSSLCDSDGPSSLFLLLVAFRFVFAVALLAISGHHDYIVATERDIVIFLALAGTEYRYPPVRARLQYDTPVVYFRVSVDDCNT